MLKLFNSPLLVVGMHRSGTTMFTKILRKKGYFMGKDLSSNSESYMFGKLNENLLNKMGGSWTNPVEIPGSFQSAFNRKNFYFDFLRIRRNPFLPLRFKSGKKWGWKDPRNTFTVNYWKNNHFPKLKVLHIYRNGVDVAFSLKVRNDKLGDKIKVTELSDFTFNFRLWEKYVARAFEIKNETGIPQFHVSYEDIIRKEPAVVTALEEFLGIKKLSESIDKISVKPSSINKIELLSEAEKKMVNESVWMKKLKYI